MPRVFVIDPLPVEREGYAAILSRKTGFDVVGLTATVEEAERSLTNARPEVVLLDARVTGLTWKDAAARLLHHSPDAHVLLAVGGVDEKLLLAASTAGIRGILLKSSSPMEVRRAVRAVASGQTFFEAVVPEDAASPAAERLRNPFGLTRQQLRVLELISRGLTNKDVGRELHVSEHTVKTHVTQILRKLRARDRAHAAVIALHEGLV
jgi:DNA-binding NarL/FixJ family response regulator